MVTSSAWARLAGMGTGRLEKKVGREAAVIMGDVNESRYEA